MSAQFQQDTASITFATGGTTAMAMGAHTIAALIRMEPFNSRFSTAAICAAGKRELTVADGPIYGYNDFSSGFSTTAQSIWYVVAICKPAGSAHLRCHLWTYAADGSGTMAHGEAVGAANQPDASAGNPITSVQVGNTSVTNSGEVAVVGMWDVALSDAQLDTLKSANLSAWSALGPKALLSFKNWNGTTGATDVVGTSTMGAVSGSILVGVEPPSFNYTLSATFLSGVARSAAVRMQSQLTTVELGNPPTRVARGLTGSPRTGVLQAWPAVQAVATPPSTGQIWPRSGGSTGAAGATGPQGPAGSKWFVGHGAPTPRPTGAVAGDFYLDIDTGNVWSL